MNKDKLISEAIELTCDSLTSHLQYTHKEMTELEIEREETNTFHKDCIRDYVKVINILIYLYE